VTTTATHPAAPAAASHWRRYRTLYLLIAVCAAPVVASYLMYYVFPPAGRTNYGELIVPQRPTPALELHKQDGAVYDIRQLLGNWVMLKVDGAACDEPCRKLLWQMRQLRTMQGKDADRIERVFMVTDTAAPDPMLLREYDGMHVLRARRAELERFLPAGEGTRIEDHVFLIDPIGNLMLRWPKDADPNRMKRDISRLLKASRIG
jgi:hypothetical protein